MDSTNELSLSYWPKIFTCVWLQWFCMFDEVYISERETESVCERTDWCEYWLDPTTCFPPIQTWTWSPRSPTFSLTMNTWQKHDSPIHDHHDVSQPSNVHVACGAVVTVQNVDRMRGRKMTFYFLSAVRSIHIVFFGTTWWLCRISTGDVWLLSSVGSDWESDKSATFIQQSFIHSAFSKGLCFLRHIWLSTGE